MWVHIYTYDYYHAFVKHAPEGIVSLIVYRSEHRRDYWRWKVKLDNRITIEVHSDRNYPTITAAKQAAEEHWPELLYQASSTLDDFNTRTIRAKMGV